MPQDIEKIEDNVPHEAGKEVTGKEEWFLGFLEELKATVVEGEFGWRWSLIESRHGIGRVISDEADIRGVSILSLLKAITIDPKQFSFRTLYYCVKFYRAFPSLADAPFEKNISFRDIIGKYLTDGSGFPHEEKKSGSERRVERVVDCGDAIVAYLGYLHENGCLICGEQAEAHHWPKTRGAGAQEWECIPLCRNHHNEYQGETGKLFIDHMTKITDYFYTMMIVTMKSYMAAYQELQKKDRP